MNQKVKRAILIDDDQATNVYHKIIVEKTDVFEEYHIFDCALTALEFLKQLEKGPELILLDINMPKMNGWEFLEAYEQLDQTSELPKVIILTTSLGTFDKNKAESNEMVSGFRQKPLTSEMLREIISSI